MNKEKLKAKLFQTFKTKRNYDGFNFRYSDDEVEKFTNQIMDMCVDSDDCGCPCCNQTEMEDGTWAVSKPIASSELKLRTRIKNAWLVLKGQAFAKRWY